MPVDFQRAAGNQDRFAMVDVSGGPSSVSVQLSKLIQKLSVQTCTSYDHASCALLHDLLSKHFASTTEFLCIAEDHLRFQQYLWNTIHDVCGFTVSERVVQRLELFFLTGLIEASQKDQAIDSDRSSIDLAGCVGKRLLYYLYHGCSDLHALVISIAERWWIWLSTVDCENKPLDPEATAMLTKIYSAVLMHWDSDDSMTVRQIRHFLASVLSGSHKCHVDVISLVYDRILGSPACAHGCVLLHKGALNQLTPVLQHLDPVKVLDRSPFLTTSLLMALGHNYTAATAADALNVLLMHGSRLYTTKSNEVYTWLNCVLAPLLKYILFEELSCTTAQELLGSTDASPQTIRQIRRENFANHCMGRNFCTMQLIELPACGQIRAYCCSNWEPGLSLAELLLRCLCSSSAGRNVQSAPSSQHRLFLWLKLFAAHGNKVQLVQNKLDLSPLIIGLLHTGDQIRSLALIGIASLGSTILSHWDQLADPAKWIGSACPPPMLMRLFVIGVILLHGSPSPAARKMLLSAFDELVRSVRNACSSVRDVTRASISSSLERLLPEANRRWLPEVSLGLLSSTRSDDACFTAEWTTRNWTRHELALSWFAQFVDFQSHLWANTEAVSESSTHPAPAGMFWPGMTYQRCKVLTELAYHAIGLCNLEHTTNGDNAAGQWRTGYAPNSIENLRRLIRLISSELKWPFDAPETLSAILQSLPVLKPDIQGQLLMEFVQHNWPEMSQIPLSQSDPGCVPHWLEKAMHWSDSHIWAVYTAGANTLAFLATRGYLKHYDGQPPLDHAFDDKLQHLRAVFLAGSQKQSKLLHVAQNETGLGCLMAIDQMLLCLCNGKSPHRIPDNLYRFLMSRQLALTCLDLCNHCLRVMGCQPWSGMDSIGCTGSRQGAPSFRELGQSVLRAALSGLHASTGGQNSESESGALLVESIELLPEYQHVLSWAWNTLRLCCNIVAQWSALQKRPHQSQLSQQHDPQQPTERFADCTEDTSDVCTRVGYQLLHVLLHCRHRGTVESVSASLQFYLVAADSCDKQAEPHCVPVLITCEQVLDLCWRVLCNYSYSVTRRAAGLWPAVKAALSAERARGTRRVPDLLIRWLERLIDLASPDSDQDISDLRVDSPRALAMHLLRGLFADARLRAHSQSIPATDRGTNFVVEAIQRAVILGFTAPVWTISNAALQLHSALVLRLTGSNSGRPPPAATVVFDCHVPLLDVCVNRLEDHVRQGANSSATELLPLLTLIVRMAPGSGASCSQSIRMRAGLEHVFLNHTSATIRKLAASAFLVFLPSEFDDKSGPVTDSGEPCALCRLASIGPWRLVRTPNCCPARPVSKSDPRGPNAIHGQLCLLRAWYEQPVSSRILIQRQSAFDWIAALGILHQLILGPVINPGSWFLAAQLCDLMTCVCTAGSNAYWDSSLRPGLISWYRTRAECLRGPPSCQPFHIDALIALHRFLDRVCGSSLTISSDPPLLSDWPTNSVRRLLGALLDADDPQDSALFATAAVYYWLECRAPTADLLLSWRVVHTWACAIRCGRAVTITPSMCSRVLDTLQTLLDSDGPGSTDAANRANVVLCEAALLNDALQPTEARLDHWLDQLGDCLHPACLEPARVTGSEAIRVWLSGLRASRATAADLQATSMVVRLCNALITLRQRHKFLNLLFSSIFDECGEVRRTIGLCISMAVEPSLARNTLPLLAPGFVPGSCEPIAHLVAAHLLLYDLVPALLLRIDEAHTAETTRWLKAQWTEVMFDLNRRLVEELLMHQRNVLYEREADNDFCEPRLLLELITNRLHHEALSTEQWDSLREELQSNVRAHLSGLLKENSLTEDVNVVCGTHAAHRLFSPAQFAHQLGLNCLLH